MSEIYEVSIETHGFCTDADGNLLDSEGNIVEPDEPEEDNEPEDNR